MSPCDSSDDSDAGAPSLTEVCVRYEQAAFRDAFHRSLDYKRASEELADLYALARNAASKKVSKAVLDLLCKDTVTAISCCDGLARNREACRRLVGAASQFLPQAKRKLVQRAYKSECQAAAKSDKKEDRSSEVQQQQDWKDLPAELLASVLDRLDPYALASAGLVCRAWHAEMQKQDRWRCFIRLCYTPPEPEVRNWQSSWTGCARGTMRWRSNRVIIHERLSWSGSSLQETLPEEEHPTVRMVTSFIMHGSISKPEASSDNDSEDDEDAPHMGRLWQRVFL